MAAREENITRAAERMHVTQPTLSRQLIQLEDELGVELFKRNKHSISLTEDGMILKQRAQEMISIEEKIFYDLSHKDDTLTGTVSMGCGETQTVDELCFRPLMPQLETGSVMVWKKHRSVSPAVREFIEYIKNA